MVNNKLKINLFGDAWKLKQIFIEKKQKEHWLKIAERLRKPLYEALIDPFFYHYLNDKKISSIDDIKGIEIQGLLNNHKNQIEIWYQGKKVQKLKINDLNNDLLLFPLYNSTVSKVNDNLAPGIYVEQKEIGLFGSFELANVPNFNIDNLEFQLLEFREKLLVRKLEYSKQFIALKKKDTVVNYQYGFEIK